MATEPPRVGVHPAHGGERGESCGLIHGEWEIVSLKNNPARQDQQEGLEMARRRMAQKMSVRQAISRAAEADVDSFLNWEAVTTPGREGVAGIWLWGSG